MTMVIDAASTTVKILATVSPPIPAFLAMLTTTGFASAVIPWREISITNVA